MSYFRYQKEFGFTMPDRKIYVNDVRVRGIGKTEILEEPVLHSTTEPAVLETVKELHCFFCEQDYSRST